MPLSRRRRRAGDSATDAGFRCRILGVDVAVADRETLAKVATLLFRHGAIVLRGQSLDQSAQVAFTKVFGEPAGNDYPEWCDPEYPEIYVISNKVVDGRKIGDPAAGLNWHTDMNYHRNPALCTMLYALEVPKEGSDTLLADVCAPGKRCRPNGSVNSTA